jgi:hypothetical protein
MELVSRSVNDDKGVINASDKALPWHMASRFGFMHVCGAEVTAEGRQ